MKKVLLLSSMLFLSVCTNSFASSEYTIDDVAIETTLNSGVQVASLVSTTSTSSETATLGSATLPASAPTIKSDGTALTPFLLAFFLGGLGVHRFYMGTETLTGIGYILTLGGCGIVATIDWIVLLVALINKESISKYEDNPKFFMWAGN